MQKTDVEQERQDYSGKDFAISISSRQDPVEVASRMRIQESQAFHLLRKDLVLFYFSLGLITLLVCVCCWTVFSSAPAADKAMTILIEFAAGAIGYLFGKNSKYRSSSCVEISQMYNARPAMGEVGGCFSHSPRLADSAG